MKSPVMSKNHLYLWQFHNLNAIAVKTSKMEDNLMNAHTIIQSSSKHSANFTFPQTKYGKVLVLNRGISELISVNGKIIYLCISYKQSMFDHKYMRFGTRYVQLMRWLRSVKARLFAMSRQRLFGLEHFDLFRHKCNSMLPVSVTSWLSFLLSLVLEKSFEIVDRRKRTLFSVGIVVVALEPSMHSSSMIGLLPSRAIFWSKRWTLQMHPNKSLFRTAKKYYAIVLAIIAFLASNSFE